MPLIKIKHIEEGATVGVWHATESLDFFSKQVPASYRTGFDAERFSENRKKEFLASRFLLKQLLNDDTAVLEIKKNGRLTIAGGKHHLSLSHSKDRMAAIVSENHPVGIDIEEIRPRVKKVMHKFLNEEELNTLGDHPEIWKIVLCWSAKESIYKMLDRMGLSFSRDIILDIPQEINSGNFTATITGAGTEQRVKVFFEQHGDFILTYCSNILE